MSKTKHYLNIFRDKKIDCNFIRNIEDAHAEIASCESDFSNYIGTVQITFSSNGSELSIMDRQEMIDNSLEWKINFQIEEIKKEIKKLQTMLQKSILQKIETK